MLTIMARSGRRVSARSFLIAFSATLLLPVLALVAFGIFYYARHERERLEQTALQTARQVGVIVDGEIRNLLSSIDALAASSALLRGDFAEFHAEAQRYVSNRDAVVVLRTTDGKQLANSQVDFAKLLPPAVGISASEHAALSSGRPVVSNVYNSPVSGEARVAVAKRVLPERSDYLLAITVPTSHFLKALGPAVPTKWIVGVGDQAGNYVTNSMRHDEVTGKPGLASYMSHAIGREGTFYATSGAGVDLLAGYVRSDLAGWLIAANIPAEVLHAPLRRTLLLASAFALFVAGLTVGFAIVFSGRLSGAASALAEKARTISEGRPLPPVASGISEVAVIDRALGQAAEAVAERSLLTKRLELALHEKEVLLKEVNHRVKNSLQLVTSLLNLQRGRIRDETTQEHFDESAQRIGVVAYAHQRLYRDGRPDRVRLQDVLRDVCANMPADAVPTLQAAGEASDCTIDMDMVIPLSLILNELLVGGRPPGSSFRYRPIVRVCCRKQSESVVVSVVAPVRSGAATSAAGDIYPRDLIAALVRQVRARLDTIEGPDGRTHVLSIRATREKPPEVGVGK